MKQAKTPAAVKQAVDEYIEGPKTELKSARVPDQPQKRLWEGGAELACWLA